MLFSTSDHLNFQRELTFERAFSIGVVKAIIILGLIFLLLPFPPYSPPSNFPPPHSPPLFPPHSPPPPPPPHSPHPSSPPHFLPQVVGDFGLKVIVQAILPGIIASLGAAGR